MIQTIDLIGFLTLGLLGGFGHCVGMCSPFVLFVSRSSRPADGGRLPALVAQSWYHAGRITTYAVLGAAAGTLGGVVQLAGTLLGFQRAAAIVAGGVLVAWALVSLSDLVPRLGGGGRVFTRVAGALKGRLLGHPFATGLFLGFLPCGLVYSALIAAAARGGTVQGAAALAVFGMGTAPALLGVSMVDELLARNRRIINRLSQVFLLAMGVWFLWTGTSGLAQAPARASASPQTTAPAVPQADLGSRLDCLRTRTLAVVAAHRGQPDQTAAENAMSSFRASLSAGVPFLEIDVATTRDGVLALMHDDTLERTTTGSGRVDARTWAEVQAVRIKRADGTVLDDRVPAFPDVLAWGREANAYFEVDVKPTTKFGDVVDAIHAAKMVDRVVVVTYTLADAVTLHRLDPRLMISVTLDTPEALAEARKVIPSDRMLGWTGTANPQRQPFAALRAAGIEPIFGTLGRPGVRLDDVYLADGNPSEYGDLVRSGVVMIASDAAVAAQKAIGYGYQACFR